MKKWNRPVLFTLSACLSLSLLAHLFVQKIHATETQASETLGRQEASDASETKESSESTAVSRVQGGRIEVAVSQEPDFFDPHQSIAAGTKEIFYNVFEGLMRLNVKGELEPNLAERVTLSADARSVDVQLKKNVLFHDGQTMTEADVIYSLLRAAGQKDLENPKSQMLGQIETVSQTGDHQLKIELKKAEPDILAALTVAIVPEHVKDLNSNPIGTGPFSFDHYVAQQELTLKRFKDYHGSKKAAVDEVRFKIVGSTDAALLEFRTGGVDVFPYMTQDMTMGLDANLKISDGSADMVQILALNNETQAFKDPKVREAIDLLVDRDQIIELVAGGHASPVYSAVSPAMAAAFNQDLKVTRDVEKAKTLLQEAGYTEQQPLHFVIKVPSNYSYHVNTASVLVPQLQEAPVKVEVQTIDWGVWLDQVYKQHDFEATIIALPPSEFTAAEVLTRYQSENRKNFIHFKSKAYDELLSKLDQSLDPQERNKIYKELQKQLLDEHASVYLQDAHNITGLRQAVLGYQHYPAYVQAIVDLSFATEEDALASLNR